MSETKEATIRIVHKPHLNYPWQILVQRLNGKWQMLEARKTQAEAVKRLARIQSDRNLYGRKP